MRRRLLGVALAVGIGLVLAPAVFQMFSRAPKGGEMIDEFRPYMTDENVEEFQGYMAEIDAAEAELRTTLPGLLEPEADAAGFPSLTRFHEEWPRIEADMSDDMLVTIERMIPNFEAVDALPPFPLFPWFFVLPGALVAVVAALAIRRDRRGRPSRPLVLALAGLGVAIVLAPAVFQMFSRAPQGKEMIDEFRPLMTPERVATVQGYFLTMGAAEGEVRTQVQPLVPPERWTAELPAVVRFTADWPTISTEFAPMIGAMSDNLDNYAAVDALPPFSLFPWFFVVPGLLVAGLAAVVARGVQQTADSSERAGVDIPARLERRGT